MNKLLLFLMGFLFYTIGTFAQKPADTTATGRNYAISLYFDCPFCDIGYFKSEFDQVNYVNDPSDADVHILVTTLAAGNGGSAYRLIFSGYGKYAGDTDTLDFMLDRDANADDERDALLNRIKTGLVPYLLRTPLKDKIVVMIMGDYTPETTDDPFRNWVFSLFGQGSLDYRKTYRSVSLISGVSAEKITSQIKIESDNLFSYDQSELKLYEDDSVVYQFTLIQREWTSSIMVAFTIGKHLGVGGMATFGSCDYNNLDFQMVAGPGIELNLYDYKFAFDKRFTFFYCLAYEHDRYRHLTIYNRTTEDLFRHDLRVRYFSFQKWGSISGSASFTQYLDNPSSYAASAGLMASIRLSRFIKGLSFNVLVGCNYLNDQRTLSQQAYTPEDILTGRREMENDFSYSLQAGISYSFGSKQSNAVNPRFE